MGGSGPPVAGIVCVSGASRTHRRLPLGRHVRHRFNVAAATLKRCDLKLVVASQDVGLNPDLAFFVAIHSPRWRFCSSGCLSTMAETKREMNGEPAAKKQCISRGIGSEGA